MVCRHRQWLCRKMANEAGDKRNMTNFPRNNCFYILCCRVWTNKDWNFVFAFACSHIHNGKIDFVAKRLIFLWILGGKRTVGFICISHPIVRTLIVKKYILFRWFLHFETLKRYFMCAFLKMTDFGGVSRHVFSWFFQHISRNPQYISRNLHYISRNPRLISHKPRFISRNPRLISH